MATYLAYECGKMNQSFALTNENYDSLFRGNLVKFKLLGASDYQFVNSKTGKTTEHKIGKTVTVNQGFGGFNVNTSSYFKIDGENCFKVLESKGYTFKTVLKLDLFHPELELVDINTNQVVANLKLNVKGERQPDVVGIGHTQRNTVITTDLEDLEVIFLAAFCISKVEFSANLM